MTAHRPRVLALHTRQDAEREIGRLGLQEPALQWLADKSRVLAVRLEEVSGRAAALLKQECLAVGCDCAVAPEVASFDDAPRPVIVLATPRQYERLLDRLPGQALGLPLLGDAIRAVLAAYEACRRPQWTCRGREAGTDQGTVVMGIINVTSDSFSGDGLGDDLDAAVQQGRAFAEAGAAILDVGAESTRPGSLPVSADEQIARVVPVVRALAEQTPALVSVDTQLAQVARAALEAGAAIVNDVSGLRGKGMVETVAEYDAGAVIMHMLGEPRTMQTQPRYADLMTEVYDFLCRRVEAALEAGVPEDALAVDPGFGFGKTVQHNLELLRRLRELHSLGRPVLIGTSRKSTIGQVLDRPADERLLGTAATCAVAIAHGAHVIRVHDVSDMVQVARMTDAILDGWDSDAAD